MKVSLSQIKAWFKKGMYPTESQFDNTFDSFWHKDDVLPLSAIQNLTQVLNDKANVALLNTKADADHNHDDAYAAKIHTHDQYLTGHQDISGKADKVVDAVAGDLAALDDEGNLTDSGKKVTDFADADHNHDDAYAAKTHTHDQYITEHQDISGKQDKLDESLTTNDKTTTGAINELNENSASLEERIAAIETLINQSWIIENSDDYTWVTPMTSTIQENEDGTVSLVLQEMEIEENEDGTVSLII